MKHLRYLVYWDDSEKPQKQVALWTDPLVHPDYAEKNHIQVAQRSSLGYIGFNQGQWILYEHYQMDEKPNSEQEDKILVQRAIQQFPERNNPVLQAELAETYQKEKHLFTYIAKEDLKKCWQAIKDNFIALDIQGDDNRANRLLRRFPKKQALVPLKHDRSNS